MDIKSLLKQYREVDAKLSEAIRANGNEFIEGLFKDIFDQFPNIHKLCILGWTPYFNDGDACTHSSEVFVGARHKSWRNDGTFSYDYEDYSVAEEFFSGSEEFDEFEEDYADYLAALPEEHVNDKATDDELDAASKMLSHYEDIIDRIYDTNFIVRAVRLPTGEISVSDEYYNPEY